MPVKGFEQGSKERENGEGVSVGGGWRLQLAGDVEADELLRGGSVTWPAKLGIHARKNRRIRKKKKKKNLHHSSTSLDIATMHLMYTLDSSGKRIYTLKKIAHGEVTKSAHPARFSPDDKYSR
ncbi:hypothetical protein Dda_4265 [Drechslerella dactyloides]|uniref:H/ACA ribonucleoprotein complex subunit NOP10 n=1 Tax=Drechslerella dactyloides TaxID=74499 RepID=A0AAD6NKQ0_DREDA|nr:hypothetical protein Dda_4265 [Drechslerella dactyloides]